MTEPRPRGPIPDACGLCDRELNLSFHHLIPRKTHRKKWCRERFSREQMDAGVYLCRDCHSAVHRFLSHRELAEDYNTPEKLLDHPEVGRFVNWVRRQNRTRNWTAPPRD